VRRVGRDLALLAQPRDQLGQGGQHRRLELERPAVLVEGNRRDRVRPGPRCGFAAQDPAEVR